MHSHRFLLPTLIALTVARFALLPTVDLAPIEALTAEAGQRGGWMWAEAGPLMTWLVRACAAIFGQSEFGVRFLAPLLAFVTSLLVWRLAHEMFDRQTAAWSVLIVNVLPAFNMAAVFFTSGSIAFAGYTLLALLLRRALIERRPAHRLWLGVAGCVSLLILADWRNGLVMLCLVLGVWLSAQGRQHWLRLGLVWVLVAWSAVMVGWVFWSRAHGWPLGGEGGWSPEWRIAPNVFRWVLMLSPLLSGLLMGELWTVAQGVRSRGRSELGLLLGIAAPLLVADFAWGVWRPWPDTGLAAWSVFAVMFLCHRARQTQEVPMRSKVAARTAIVFFAAFQSLILLRTDLVRDVGVPWPFSQNTEARRTYRRFFSSDPSAVLHGWRESASLVQEVVSSSTTSGARWFLVADDWQMAAELSFYMEPGTKVFQSTPAHPSVHVFQGAGSVGPYEYWPRYDGGTGEEGSFAGANALYITDDTALKSPPPSLVRSFEQWRIVSIAKVMHGGHQVRTIKIFACHNYRPPDF